MDASLDQTIRFCGQNQTLMEMRYNGVDRLVEPYSYRTSNAGNALFYAYCYKDAKIESFRMDRIEYAKATKIKFSPRWPVEVV